ncbi:MarR family winged helix-turn-helix transcriptional regulator [Paenibacillus methanolicus]|uniref:DNA-binding MarR family transcriptional regulator n=1 Tax=Paenibacillus methanolicus TaxID=582686 RepID=A0A5S5BW84_9BACL|nr:MarR family transcriptional regulator [Paenibacillus methanolicus]TYP71239.1 DNA-binding MarR family transcriptional regulator [Paenibacillus methanolicus]
MEPQFLRELIVRYQDVFFSVNSKLDAVLKDHMPDGLTIDQYATLRYIRDNGPCTSSELADIFCVGKSSITAIVNRLFEKELIERVPHKKDRRVTHLNLTEEGSRVTNDMEERIQRALAPYLDQFEAEEAMAFINTFEKLARVLHG